MDYNSSAIFFSLNGFENYTINVMLMDDQEVEGNETFLGRLSLTNSQPNLILRTGETTITILDNGESSSVHRALLSMMFWITNYMSNEVAACRMHHGQAWHL